MASKRINYTSGNLIDTGSEYYGWSLDNTSGLSFSSTTVTEQVIPVHSELTHRVTETNNPIWNQVLYGINADINSTNMFEGSVTLHGLSDDGTFTILMEHLYNTTLTSADDIIKTFDLLGSSCTNSQTSKTLAGSAAGTFTVALPISYQNYGSVDLVPTWIDTAWAKRRAMSFDKSGGQLQNTNGHKADYYIYTIYVTYDADMNANFSDIRFTANDGQTICNHYLLRYTNSTTATFLVAIPSYMIDINKQEVSGLSTGFSTNDLSYLYCYYGNAAATSSSDVTLGGQMLFYDEFNDASIDATKWATSIPANSSITETGGYLELQVDGGVTASPSAISTPIGANFDSGDTVEYIFDITAHVPLSGTVANNGTSLRMYYNSTNYFEVAFRYSASGYGGSGAGWYAYLQAVKAGVGSGVAYTYYLGTGTATRRYIKIKLEYVNLDGAANAVGYGPRVTAYHSYDGATWDFIGSELRSSGITTGAMRLSLHYIGASGVATSKYIRLNGVYAYYSYASNHEYVEDYFNNAEVKDRWLSVTGARATAAELSGSLTLAGTAGGGHNWTGAAWDSPTIYVQHKRGGYGANEMCIYQTEITSMTEAAGGIGRAGIHIFDSTTVATQNHLEYSIAKNGTTGVYTLYAMRQAGGVQTDIISVALGNTVTVTLPCHIRLMVDPNGGVVYFDYSTDSINWNRGQLSYTAYINAALTTGSYMGLGWLDGTASIGNGVFSYFKSGTMGRDTFDTTKWSGEESYASYPLAPAAPLDTDTVLSFATPANMIRNNAVYLRTVGYGAGYNNSKILYISDQNAITLGPDGTDKYIGMKLVFDFKFGYNDTFSIPEISYIYEVI